MSDEEIKVEAHVIETDLLNPTKYDQWLTEQRSKVEQALAECKTTEVTDAASYKSAKACRSEIRRVISDVDSERKARTAELESVLKRVRNDFGDVLAEAKERDQELKGQIDAWDAGALSRKMAEVEQAYVEYAPELANLVPFSVVQDKVGTANKWKNKTVGVETCKKDMYAFVDRVAEDEHTIDQLEMTEDERRTLKAMYFKTLDLNSSINQIVEARERREKVDRLEEQRKAWSQQQLYEDEPVEPDTYEDTGANEAQEPSQEPAEANAYVFEVTVLKTSVTDFVAAMKAVDGVHGHKIGETHV